MTTATTTPAKGRPKKPRSRVGFTTPAGVPPLVEAASLLLTLMRHLKVNSLDELQTRWYTAAGSAANYDHQFWRSASDLHLTEEQDHLLRTYQPVLRLLRVSPGISLAVCPECMSSPVDGTSNPASFHGWQLVGGSGAPTTCKVTLGCPGKPIKASAAKKYAIPGEQPAETPDTDLS